MDHERFWIVGGEYRDMTFSHLIPGTEHVFGPFATRTEAHEAWRRVSERHRSQCLMRFVIASEGGQRSSERAA